MSATLNAPASSKKRTAHVNRLAVVDRRARARRQALAEDTPPPVERRTVERRKQIDPTTCERDYSDDEVDFMRAMDEYKRLAGRQFPTWSEVLEVVRAIGYERVNASVEISTILEDD
ncbi:hypothetical protein [Alienimonas chondri]|uniref:Uncharacterized protein n=1 Tax=Alienimonas chondri TaxID=2681879 RepID=A0ABX1V7Z9_9PLAN|nr:hypothetical protein [Alienimonas chondri]NNJ24003.1 hypothetical protein [Alienimonas chondri]